MVGFACVGHQARDPKSESLHHATVVASAKYRAIDEMPPDLHSFAQLVWGRKKNSYTWTLVFAMKEVLTKLVLLSYGKDGIREHCAGEDCKDASRSKTWPTQHRSHTITLRSQTHTGDVYVSSLYWSFTHHVMLVAHQPSLVTHQPSLNTQEPSLSIPKAPALKYLCNVFTHRPRPPPPRWDVTAV